MSEPGVIGAALAAAPVLERLARFTFAYTRTPFAQLPYLAPLVAGARAPRLTIDIGAGLHPTIVELERDGKRYARAKLTLGPSGKVRESWQQTIANEAIAIIDALPGVAIELDMRESFAQGERVRAHLASVA